MNLNETIQDIRGKLDRHYNTHCWALELLEYLLDNIETIEAPLTEEEEKKFFLNGYNTYNSDGKIDHDLQMRIYRKGLQYYASLQFHIGIDIRCGYTHELWFALDNEEELLQWINDYSREIETDSDIYRIDARPFGELYDIWDSTSDDEINGIYDIEEFCKEKGINII